MPQDFTVTIYADVVIQVLNVCAETPREAFEKAEAIATESDVTRGLDQEWPTPQVKYTGFADHVSGALVDFPHDPENTKSVYLNQFGHEEHEKCRLSDNALYPELAVAEKNLETVARELGDDWLQSRLKAAIAEIQDVSQVIKLRANENHSHRRKRVPC